MPLRGDSAHPRQDEMSHHPYVRIFKIHKRRRSASRHSSFFLSATLPTAPIAACVPSAPEEMIPQRIARGRMQCSSGRQARLAPGECFSPKTAQLPPIFSIEIERGREIRLRCFRFSQRQSFFLTGTSESDSFHRVLNQNLRQKGSIESRTAFPMALFLPCSDDLTFAFHRKPKDPEMRRVAVSSVLFLPPVWPQNQRERLQQQDFLFGIPAVH